MIFVVSTTGQGDTPDSMKVTKKALLYSFLLLLFFFFWGLGYSIVFLILLLHMQVFWKYLLQRNLSQHWLKGTLYAVFGLGDSGYQKYNVIMFICLSKGNIYS